MLKLDTRADLEALHTGSIQESLTLEYKSSGAVEKTEANKMEIAKDVSALANAAGGQIVYGMTEQNHLPAGLDAGLDRSQFPGIWFEQVIQQRINEVPLDPTRRWIAVVVTVPAAQGRAPHQAKDGRYYRRHNFSNLIMNRFDLATPRSSSLLKQKSPSQSGFACLLETGRRSPHITQSF
jgi:predicted HTH transcriptional regulator